MFKLCSFCLVKNINARLGSIFFIVLVLFVTTISGVSYGNVTATEVAAIDAAAAVAFAKVHVEKCNEDQPSMKEEVDAAFLLWRQRNQKHVAAAESRADYQEIEIKVRAQINKRGLLPVSDCQLLIQRATSTDSDKFFIELNRQRYRQP